MKDLFETNSHNSQIYSESEDSLLNNGHRYARKASNDSKNCEQDAFATSIEYLPNTNPLGGETEKDKDDFIKKVEFDREKFFKLHFNINKSDKELLKEALDNFHRRTDSHGNWNKSKCSTDFRSPTSFDNIHTKKSSSVKSVKFLNNDNSFYLSINNSEQSNSNNDISKIEKTDENLNYDRPMVRYKTEMIEHKSENSTESHKNDINVNLFKNQFSEFQNNLHLELNKIEMKICDRVSKQIKMEIQPILIKMKEISNQLSNKKNGLLINKKGNLISERKSKYISNGFQRNKNPKISTKPLPDPFKFKLKQSELFKSKLINNTKNMIKPLNLKLTSSSSKILPFQSIFRLASHRQNHYNLKTLKKTPINI